MNPSRRKSPEHPHVDDDATAANEAKAQKPRVIGLRSHKPQEVQGVLPLLTQAELARPGLSDVEAVRYFRHTVQTAADKNFQEDLVSEGLELDASDRVCPHDEKSGHRICDEPRSGEQGVGD
jgi:hypothetical protein